MDLSVASEKIPGTFRLVAQRLNHYATPDLRLYANVLYTILLCFIDELNWIESLKYVKPSGPGNG
jgi:hypothetical protein